MGLQKCLTEKDGIFTSVAQLEESSPIIDSIVAVKGIGSIQLYTVDNINAGNGILLPNSYYANPVTEESSTMVTTKMVSGVITLPEGASGDIITISAGPNEYVRLVALAANGFEEGVTIYSGVNEISPPVRLVGSSTNIDGDYSIATRVTANASPTSFEPITGGKGEDLIINKSGGSTTSGILYMYQILG